jgi:predicted AAA+ superfamily ATPase
MSVSNYDRIGKALKLLNSGLAPFVAAEFKRVFPDDALKTAKGYFTDTRGLNDDIASWDTSAIFKLMENGWADVFSDKFSRTHRSMVVELRDIRNRWAHEDTKFTGDDVYRTLDTIERLLLAISSPLADQVAAEKGEVLRLRYLEGTRTEARKQQNQPISPDTTHGLPAWRDVITPHDDVARGSYQQAEFAADLWQVYLGQGMPEYKDPVQFFQRTYLTENLKGLLVGALKRLKNNQGDPVVRLQTNFGGGKTHSMLALWHLFSGVKPQTLLGAEQILREAAVADVPKARRAVLVGNKISPGNPVTKEDGTVVRTLWGELAWQLGGKDGYAMVAADDEKATNPGDRLREVFDRFGPCLILVDEWVAYARQLHDLNQLPGGSFETHFSFAQALTESAKLAKNCLLVVSLPASDTATSPHAQTDDMEVGGERGRAALDRISNVIGRLESTWKPASPEESFEIVRRRLFVPLLSEQGSRQRDLVAVKFAELYQEQHMEFPSECRDADYRQRIQAAYPIHPELFDRLYSDWSTLVRFQRTRGVLRLMAAVIHSLWENGDRSPLIMPCSIPIDDPVVQQELTRYLSDNWAPILEKDVDGPNSLPRRIDGDVPNLGRYAAARRTARAIYVGSAPKADTPNRGIDEKRVKLGCVLPGESPSLYSDALRRLATSATFLYQDGARYWYGTQPTVTKLAQDRTEGLKARPEAIQAELERRMQALSQGTRYFSGVHVMPQDSGEVQDSAATRLVVLGIDTPYTSEPSAPAMAKALELLAKRANSPRLYQNALVFLVPEKSRLQELEESVRRFLAWKSIVDEKETLNLTPHLLNQASTQLKAADAAVEGRIPEVYKMMLVPSQATPQEPVLLKAIRATGGDNVLHACHKKLLNDELLVVKLGGARLRMELDRIPLWQGNHIGISELTEHFPRYVYLPRLLNTKVLHEGISDGLQQTTWLSDSFAYAESFDEKTGRYRGLAAGKLVSVSEGNRGLLVKSEVARRQLDAEVAPIGPPEQGGSPGQPIAPLPGPTVKKLPTLFHVHQELDGERLAMKVSRTDENIIAHLGSLPGAEVKVTLHVEVVVPGGIPEQVQRTVNENARTLKIDGYGFQ